MTSSTPEPSTSGTPTPTGHPERPPNLGFMVGWLVFLGIYQITLAWRFGTFFEGEQGDLRQYYGGAALEPLYATIGVLALIVAWGGWRLRPWAYTAAWVLQGLVFVLIVGGEIFWIDGQARTDAVAAPRRRLRHLQRVVADPASDARSIRRDRLPDVEGWRRARRAPTRSTEVQHAGAGT